MGFQVSPGVEVKEIDLTTVIPAVATSIGGFVGTFEWGPVSDVTLVSSEDKLAARFGVPGSNVSSTDFLTAGSFLAYTGALKVVRVVEKTNVNGNVAAANSTSGKTTILNFAAPVGATVGEIVTQTLIEVENGVTTTTRTAYGKVISVNGAAITVSTDTNSNFTVDPNSEYRVGENLVTVPVSITSTNKSILVLNEKQVEEETVSLLSGGGFIGRYPGARGNDIRVIVLTESNFGTPEFVSESKLFDSKPESDRNEIHVVVIDTIGKFGGLPNTVLETYAYVQTNQGAKKEDGSNNFFADVINLGSSFIYVGDASAVDGGIFTLTGGNNGSSPDIDEIQFGWDLFRDAESTDVNLLVIGSQPAVVGQYVTQNIAERRKDCVVFISPEKDDVVGNSSPLNDILEFRSDLNVNSSYAVMDSGWKYVYNKYQDRFEWIPLCADTAGLCARTDSERDPWFSPAGFNRGNVKNVIKLAYNPDQADRDELYKAGVNPVVNFKGVGPVLFGDKTLLVRPSAFDRINVRRLFIVLEKAISTAAKFSLFELNDQFTRAQFVALVEPFLREVQARRGIFDFRVVCDETNNTGEVIDTNRFVGDIYIKPARSINFITLNFVAVRTGVDFAEVVGKF